MAMFFKQVFIRISGWSLFLPVGVFCKPSFPGIMYLVCPGPWPSTEFSPAIILKRLPYLRLGVHDKGAVLDCRLIDRFSLEEEDMALIRPVLYEDLAIGMKIDRFIGRHLTARNPD